MADEKLNTGPEVQKTEEAPAPAVADPAHGEAAVPEHPPEQAGPADPGDVVISAEQIDALMAEKRQAARAEVEKAEASREQEAGAPAPEHPAAESEKAEKPRRGRPPKSDKTERPGPEAEKEPKKAGPRKGRPSKADKEDKPAKEAAPPEQGVTEPTVPPRPVEEGKLVYLKLSELHPFHTFRPHPFKVRDDAKMQETVASIKLNGVMVPGLARPEKDIVRDMTDHEAVEAMKDSNKQRDQTLPSELAALLDLEVEDIKHQGSRLKNVAEGDVGKRSVEIVGEAHGMNYKKVMRYLRLNHLVPELMDKVDDKKMGFMPAVELSYIKPKNQRLIAVSIDGEQASPSLAQAKQLRELDKESRRDYFDGRTGEIFWQGGHSRQNEGADHDFAGRVEGKTAARAGKGPEKNGKRQVTRPHFETNCPEGPRPSCRGLCGDISPVAAYLPVQPGVGRQGCSAPPLAAACP